jgi:hypothetical protein
MPSRARIIARDKMLPEVGRIIEGHATLRRGNPGPDPHNAILKSGMIFLCAVWEIYCEDVLIESVKKVLEHFDDPRKLPQAVQMQMVIATHHEKFAMSRAMELAGNGWKDVHLEATRNAVRSLNTPSPAKIDKLFKVHLGTKPSDSWTHNSSDIDEFIRVRGEIAHRGTDAKRITRSELKRDKDMISKLIKDTDEHLYDFLRGQKMLGRVPWQKTSR